MHSEYIIIGNGIAGLSAAKEIRKNDSEGSIILVSNEQFLTYWRIKLTELLPKELRENELLVSKESWYKDNDVEVLLNKNVVKIDTDNKKVILDDNSNISYDKLLIATGSSPFIPPIRGNEKKGVFSLRTLEDLEEIQSYLKNCDTVTVIGGGLLGLEAAWALKQLDKKVNVIEHSPHLLHKQLDKEIGEKLAEKLVSEGINIFLPESSDEILGEENVKGVRLTGGKLIKTDAILISAGVRPNLDLVRNSNIGYDRGVKVDKYLRTNIVDVYAAGDVAEFNGMVIGLWTTGMEQGKIAGANMSGKKMEFTKPKLFTTLKIKDIQLFSAGNINEFDRVYEYKVEVKDVHHKLFTKNGKVTGVILYGDLKDINTLRNAVINQINIEEYLSKGLSFK